jgi:hypothetical protein
MDPIPQMVKEPRSNPYIFYKEDEVPGGFERDIAELPQEARSLGRSKGGI